MFIPNDATSGAPFHKHPATFPFGYSFSSSRSRRMAWVQIGPHKINTALICYVEQENETVRIYFNGEWEGNPIDLHFDEAKAFWKHMKAEDVMLASRDKG